MASGIPTRRTRRADENAPPAPTLKTRASTLNVPASKPLEGKDVAKSSIPVIKKSESSKSIVRARAALGEVTNAGKVKSASGGDKGKAKAERKPLLSTNVGSHAALAMRRTRSSVTDGARSRQGTAEKEKVPAGKRKTAPGTSAAGSSALSRPLVPRSRSTTVSTSATSAVDNKPLAERALNVDIQHEPEDEPLAKRRKTSTPPLEPEDDFDEAQYDEDGQEIILSSESKPIGLKSPKREGAKDEGWEDLDLEDEGDPTMVSEYVVDAFQYLMDLEKQTMPDADYMRIQNEVQWQMRTVLMDWLIEVHAKFRLLPETLFIAVNLIDRFLSLRVISLIKFQLVGLTALFIAAKYEEVICPSITHFLHMTDGGYDVEEILRAERYMLTTLEFDMSYPNPLHFLRRISKADGYDIQARTVGKFLVELGCLEHKLLPFPPSLISAAAMWLSRFCLERGDWNPNLVHYSGYSEEELLEPAQIMLDYILNKDLDSSTSFYKKYASKKHMKASVFVHQWALMRYPPNAPSSREQRGQELYVEMEVCPPEHRVREWNLKIKRTIGVKQEL